MEPTAKPSIVVGVDTSPAARAAARWAARMAQRLRGELVVVHAPEAPAATTFPAVPKSDALATVFPDELAAELEADEHVTVRRELARTGPVTALLEAAEDAQMLVLGRSGRRVGNVPAPGSTTRKVLDRSACPVVLVREDQVPPPRLPT
jgi:nucleotide-binding universal stress UspA family protein